MELVKLSELFEVKYGSTFSKKIDFGMGTTPVIKSQGTNNGVFAKLNIKSNNKRVLTVARTGSVGFCFFHPYHCYVTDDCMVLKPKFKLSDRHMLLYSFFIGFQKNRYNYSRKVTPHRLSNSLIPNVNIIEKYKNIKIPNQPNNRPYHYKNVSLSDREWRLFIYDDIFDIEKGFYNKKPASTGNEIPFVGATELNNGVTSRCSYEDIKQASRDGTRRNQNISEKIFYGGRYVTVSNDGSIGYCFFQKDDFTCSHSINPIGLKNHDMNPFIAMFLCAVIHKEKFRWAYGRKWRPSRMILSKIKLPIDSNSKPDWEFMEYYIKSLPYSSNLKEEKCQPVADKQVFDSLINRASRPA